MKTVYEFFKKSVQIRGKHAKMAGELWIKDNYQESYFKRLIDLYMIAPVIGFRMNRKAEADKSGEEEKTIFAEQIILEKDNLDFILQLILILEYSDKLPARTCIDKGFRSVEKKEEFDQYNKLFHDYMRGGIEELYERLVVKRSEIDKGIFSEKSENILMLLKRFS